MQETSGSSLNDTPSGERVHIAFFGLRNAGKSSLVNAITGQELSVVSEVKGTTTDPVKKAMELLPLGPVLIIDTPGLDDEGTLGEMRVKRARQILAQCDIAVLVHDALSELADSERELINLFDSRNLPYIIANNKADLLPNREGSGLFVSALTGENVDALKEKIAALAKNKKNEKKLIADKLNAGDVVILVIPIDKAAPKGRLILPQQQTIRDILDSGCIASVCQDTRLTQTLNALNVKPKIVITDSQVFGKVNKLVPDDILLTSFSILFARYKGDLRTLVNGAKTLSQIRDGDKILISEGCTHHRQCGDIGRDKIPEWVRNFSGSNPEFEFTSGNSFPEVDELRKFALIIHCGGCMLNEQEMHSRLERAELAGVPIVNYGLAIAHIHGILTRSLEPFEDEL
ncbi:MAG: [Synergistaceae bacterium]|nr:[FeFe] hydrogenase H-cluster maturation GTPase HydF [Synergistaceae bacterium]